MPLFAFLFLGPHAGGSKDPINWVITNEERRYRMDPGR